MKYRKMQKKKKLERKEFNVSIFILTHQSTHTHARTHTGTDPYQILLDPSLIHSIQTTFTLSCKSITTTPFLSQGR